MNKRTCAEYKPDPGTPGECLICGWPQANHVLNQTVTPVPASKDWPVCPECQFELRPGSPQPHQSGCSHASTTDWREKFLLLVSSSELNNRYAAIDIVEAQIAAAEDRGTNRWKLRKEVQEEYFQEGRASMKEEVIALVEGMKMGTRGNADVGTVARIKAHNNKMDELLEKVASLQDKKGV